MVKRPKTERLENLLNQDAFVIPVMGPTGAGKSTFINTILQEEHKRSGTLGDLCLMEVGRGLRSCTSDIKASAIQLTEEYTMGIKNRPVTIVDTPGFDDTYIDDVHILQKIADWLKQSYEKQSILAGVIYLHDISQDRFTGSVRRNLEIFKHLCGKDAYSHVVIVTTKARKLEAAVAQRYDEELRNVHWKDIIEGGVSVRSFNGDYASARLIVDNIILHAKRRFILQLQKEVAEDNKLLPATAAGKQLRFTLQQVLESQRRILDVEISMASAGVSSAVEAEQRLKELRNQMKILSAQVAALRKSSPLQRVFSRFFSIFTSV